MSSCLGRAAVPVKRVWRGLGHRLRRTTGLGLLRKDVRTCEYSDVHVMWEMLSTNGTGSGSRRGRRDAGKTTAVTTSRKASVASRWSRLVSYCSAL